jgi:hypothetical protein
MSHPLTAEAKRFREVLIDALWDDARFGYVTASSFVGTCPVCGLAVIVQFAGVAPRAELSCYGGCTEAEIGAKINLVEARA